VHLQIDDTEYRLTRKLVLLLFSSQVVLLCFLGFGQSSLQQLPLNASQAFVGSQSSVSAASLTGQADVYAGSANETGSVTLVANADDHSSLRLQLSSAPEWRLRIDSTKVGRDQMEWRIPPLPIIANSR
jgi:hypothetical protein